ncbi:DEAD/DEAH box helicase [Flavobacterium coralii]|uniref:DEAD/DEAH box helicase n=1 Tax=Flavobacterium coralii TaxID=2838017 RepID=UPI000C66FFF3|nr:RNA helicase [Flavobacterium sp.]|tara:strand:+ start:13021 stop:13659 length:639 start_codon:yes stop_codon:yes gene_type:complete
MKLKKINPGLQKALEEAGLTEPTELQKETFGTIKSGADCVVAAPDGGGKTTAIVINVIQKLEKAFEQSPRALIVVQDKARVQEMQEMFRQYGSYTDLRVYGVYEQGDIDYDKNQISVGIDVLIGTPNRLNEMFGSAGYDVNQLKMFIVDDLEAMLKVRLEPKLTRLSNSISKTQRIFFTDIITERVEFFADRIMVEPLFFEMDDEEFDEETD